MNCPACYSEIDDRSYRCKECHRVASYRRLCWRYRYSVLVIVALIGYWTIPGLIRRWFARDYNKLPVGALVSDPMTLGWLGLTDKGWFCEEPHYKGILLHLRHNVFQAKDVIVFVHGFTGDYVSTWGKPKVLLDDPRYNRNYDFVFYGFQTTFHRDLPAFEAEAAKLDGLLTHLEDNYKSITIVTHSNGGLLAMRTLLNRANDFPKKQPYKIHRIVMFAPLTENVSFARNPGLVKLLGKQIADIPQMQANTDAKLDSVSKDLKALLDPHDPLAKVRSEVFMQGVADRLYIINAERDEVADVGPNGEKIVSEPLRKVSQQPTLGPPRLATLRYSDIGGPEEDVRAKRSGVTNPAYAHAIVVKMGEQENFSFFDRFEQLVFDRIGVPPRSLSADVEQIRQSTFDRINSTIFEMNRFVVDRNPMVGLCWRNISDAVKGKLQNVPEPQRQKQTEDLVRQIYYVYIVLDQYAQLDELRSRGYMSGDDPKLAEWKRSTLPNLIGSEVGKWMLENNLMEYYSAQMNKDLQAAAVSSPQTGSQTARDGKTGE
ncbi:MAG: alpha/beta hydrolase [Chthoniobacterales bacterium]